MRVEGSRGAVCISGTRTPVHSFRDLIAWQHAYRLGLTVYRVLRTLPGDELFGLTHQVRRTAVSVASSIAEGYGRAGRAEYVRFLRMARGSVYELDTQLQMAFELGFVPSMEYEAVKAELDERERVLAGLFRSVDAP